MKKLFVFLFAGLFCVSVLLTGCSENATHGNYSDEMKIPYGTDIDPEYGRIRWSAKETIRILLIFRALIITIWNPRTL